MKHPQAKYYNDDSYYQQENYGRFKNQQVVESNYESGDSSYYSSSSGQSESSEDGSSSSDDDQSCEYNGRRRCDYREKMNLSKTRNESERARNVSTKNKITSKTNSRAIATSSKQQQLAKTNNSGEDEYWFYELVTEVMTGKPTVSDGRGEGQMQETNFEKIMNVVAFPEKQINCGHTEEVYKAIGQVQMAYLAPLSSSSPSTTRRDSPPASPSGQSTFERTMDIIAFPEKHCGGAGGQDCGGVVPGLSATNLLEGAMAGCIDFPERMNSLRAVVEPVPGRSRTDLEQIDLPELSRDRSLILEASEETGAQGDSFPVVVVEESSSSPLRKSKLDTTSTGRSSRPASELETEGNKSLQSKKKKSKKRFFFFGKKEKKTAKKNSNRVS